MSVKDPKENDSLKTLIFISTIIISPMNSKSKLLNLLFCIFINLQFAGGQTSPGNAPMIFPAPYEIRFNPGNFKIDNSTYIVLPQNASRTDSFLADLLLSEFSDKYEMPVVIARKPEFTDICKSILIGDVSNPLVKKYCEDRGLINKLTELGTEGYILSVNEKQVVVAANSKNGALFGLESLRQVISQKNRELIIPFLFVRDEPHYPFRGIKLYLPGRDNIAFFKRFIRDFAAYYKFNTVILELNANMRLEKHPELNVGAVQFARNLNFSRLDRPPGIHMEYQNSSHQDNADGGILEKIEVADLVNYMRQFNIEVIPELPSLTHSYYLLSGHEGLAENMAQPVPDTYCPLKPGSYDLYFDVLDEYIDMIHPSVIHIGHDEWRMEKDLCELCRGKDYGELYAADINKIHDYLGKKGIKIALWGDHLLESVTEKEFQTWKSSAGYTYKIPGALRPEQVIDLIPKDILVFNWFWDDINNDKQLSAFGFKQVYGNFRADIDRWDERSDIKGVLGGAPSSWAATTEFNFGKDQLVDFLGCANLLWSGSFLPFPKLAVLTDEMVSDINYRLSGKILPAEAGSKVVPVDLSSYFNSALKDGIENLCSAILLSGKVSRGSRMFNLDAEAPGNPRAVVVRTSNKQDAGDRAVNGISINQDVNSILFLHACAKEGANQKAYATIYDFDDTSELLGWYEVVYEDGLVLTIPVRYGINILDWRWKQRIENNEKPKAKYSQNQYAYHAPSILVSKPDSEQAYFFAFEWENPRFGKVIREINLKGARFSDDNTNAIILIGMSIAENTKKVQSQGTERN
jgi:hypothetical protein